MIRTRKKAIGREPSLRDQILELLIDVQRPMTARDIAEFLHINKSTPFRPLSDLVQMELITRADGLDGAEFTVNPKAVEEISKGSRRVRETKKD